MPIATAIILARGLGTRMRRASPGGRLSTEQRELADRGLKAMMPVGRPFLDYVLASLADAGFSRVGLVIGPEHELIRQRYATDVRPTRFQLDFVVQEQPLGTADAVLAAESLVGRDLFVVVNADNLYPVEALSLLRTLGGPGLIGYDAETLMRESNIEPERIGRYALIGTTPEGYLAWIIEKPAAAAEYRAPSAKCRETGAERLVSMNSWCFGPAIFPACRAIAPSPRGELELQDAVTFAIRELSERFRVVPWSGAVIDLSSRGDIAPVTERLRGLEVRL